MPKPNYNEEIWNAMKEELRACGMPKEEEIEKLFGALAKGKTPKKGVHNPIAAGIYGALIADLRQAVQNRPIKTERERDRALQQIQGLRQKLRPALADALEKIRILSPKKRRGPQPKLSEKERADACALIDAFKNSGMTTQFAIEQAAKQNRITPRLMRKVWEKKGR